MCGVAGFWTALSMREDGDRVVGAMTDTLAHRGPDDRGTWIDREAGIALGHRRLSILDLSPDGHQPMASKSGRYVTVFNGEVYNFQSIRAELETLGYTFRGHSDTEVALAAFEEWGIRRAVERFVGMFVFSIWDRRDRVLHLVRDRLGIKPVYYGWTRGGTFLFGSELKALRAHPDFRTELNRDAIALYVRYSYVPTPLSIYCGTYKLPPGSILSLATPGAKPDIQAYWTARDVVTCGLAQPFKGTEKEAVTQLEELLRDAVRLRMISDVPVGAFLSGGVDSSTVVALMQQESRLPVKTFSIGFHEEEFNEAQYAKQVAAHLGTDHTELYLSPQDCRDVIPRIPRMYDEPFSDSSQIPTFLVSALARRQVTVSLSGDGGDELFGGYHRYTTGLKAYRLMRGLSGHMLTVMGRSRAVADAVHKAGGALNRVENVVPGHFGGRRFGRRIQTFSRLAGKPNREVLYRSMMSHYDDGPALVPGATEPLTPMTDNHEWEKSLSFLDWMMYMDTVTYLPDDILTKVDRASMGVALEARVPLLDHRVVEFAWGLPRRMKYRNGLGKWVLRQVLYNHVPSQLIERPKMGFGVPVSEWMRGPLRDWAEDLLGEDRLRREGIFDPVPIRTRWLKHLSGHADYGSHLWDILMFQAWKEVWDG